MSNTVKIKNKKKKKELKINYKLWAIVFAIFVAIIVGLSVWASFHWGVGLGTIGVEPVDPQEASVSATDAASEFSTEDVITLTPEQLQQLQQQQAAQEGAGAVEDALSDSVEEAAGTEAAEGEQKAEGEEKADGK